MGWKRAVDNNHLRFRNVVYGPVRRTIEVNGRKVEVDLFRIDHVRSYCMTMYAREFIPKYSTYLWHGHFGVWKPMMESFGRRKYPWFPWDVERVGDRKVSRTLNFYWGIDDSHVKWDEYAVSRASELS